MDYREMRNLANDPVRVRALAGMTLKLLGAQVPDSAEDFLTRLSKYDGSAQLTTLQLEFLYSLREQSTRRSRVGHYSAATLVKKVFEARLDLSNFEDEEWIVSQHDRSPNIALSNNEWRHLFALCRELEFIGDEWIDLK
jgi:hypothetical protein